jgi:DNA-binding PadR family transcriptional regulator
MQSSLKNELTTAEARDVFAITEKEVQVLRHHLDAIQNQIRGLESFMDSMGFTSWIGNNSPRSIANGEFKVKTDD